MRNQIYHQYILNFKFNDFFGLLDLSFIYTLCIQSSTFYTCFNKKIKKIMLEIIFLWNFQNFHEILKIFVKSSKYRILKISKLSWKYQNFHEILDFFVKSSKFSWNPHLFHQIRFKTQKIIQTQKKSKKSNF